MSAILRIVAAEGQIDGTPIIRADVEIEQDILVERFAQLSEPDPRWKYTDQNGHFHAWSKGGTTPTLTKTYRHVDDHGTECDLGDRCEGYDASVWNCAICGAEVEPAFVTRHNVTMSVPGLKHWRAEVTTSGEGPGLRDEVTARFVSQGREWFGRGYVVGWSIDQYSSTLSVQGVGELAESSIATT